MWNLIKDFITLKKICKKYKVKLKFGLHEGRGSYSFQSVTYPSGVFTFKSKSIKVCLWDSRLWEIFHHELGHIIDAGNTVGCTQKGYSVNLFKVGIPVTEGLRDYVENSHLDYDRLLLCEARASKIAIRMLRSTDRLREGSVAYLSWALGTYISGVDKRLIADIDYKLNKYLTY